MEKARQILTQRAARAGIAVAAAAMLIGGATWHGLAAGPNPAVEPAIAVAAQAAPVASRSAALGGRDSYADVVKAVTPGVVTVRVEGRVRVRPTGLDDQEMPEMFRRFFGDEFGRGQQPRTPRNFRQRGLGSGVIVTTDGYVLTNNHVVDNADNVQVELTDGRSFAAKIVGTDEPSDLALLKVDAANLPTVALGDSDATQIGDVVLAVGNPLGIGQTVTMGIISAKGRTTSRGDGSYEDFLQTDAPINHGNSGGALVNLKGELVGINSQIVSQSDGNIGIGFAIPANMARHVMTELKTSGRVRRAQLGVTVQPVTSDLAESLGLKEVRGAIVASVAEGSAADKAGVKRGDIIRTFNGQPVQDFNSLRNRVADTAPGSTATVGIIRDGSEKSLQVKLDEAAVSKNASAAEAGGGDDKAALGVAVAPLTAETAAQAGLKRDAKGVLVQDVNPEGRAASAGIQAGDVILEVNRQPVQTVDELRAAVRKTSDRPVLLLISRGGDERFVTVKPS